MYSNGTTPFRESPHKLEGLSDLHGQTEGQGPSAEMRVLNGHFRKH